MKTYHGKPCKHCNNTERYKSSYGCVTCTKSKSHNNEYLRGYAKRPKAVARRQGYMNKYDKKRSVQLKSRMKLFYGITLEQYEQMLIEQDHKCAICGEKPERTLHTDHCHETDKVRGLLCRSCNVGLGHFKDDINRLAAAIEYLKKGL